MRLVILLLIIVVSSCSRPRPDLEEIDLVAWRNDRDGCSGVRMKMADAMIRQKEKLLRLSENEMANLIGRPDRNELYVRNQKLYSYFLKPSPTCAGNPPKQDSSRLVIRFNAMGIANEVTVE